MRVADLKSLMASYGISPNKNLGQNFLLDETVITDMIEAAQVHSTDTVLEIGPGLGVLTKALSAKAGQVVVYELDPKLAELIRGQAVPNIRVEEGDALDLPLPPRGSGALPYKIVANIPYSITGPLLRRWLAANPAPISLTVLVQAEVAERICAQPGQMSILSVVTQLHGEPRLVRWVPAEAFYPAPKVDSAVVHVDVSAGLKLDVDEVRFMRLVKFGFAQKRKQLKNTLAAGLHKDPAEIELILRDAGLSATVRAQELSLEDWKRLYDFFEK